MLEPTRPGRRGLWRAILVIAFAIIGSIVAHGRQAPPQQPAMSIDAELAAAEALTETKPVPRVFTGGPVALPKKLKHAAAIYPRIAVLGKITGRVALDVLIDPDGKVRSAKPVRSSPLFDKAALDAVRQWEFGPTLIDANPVAVRDTVFITFDLDSRDVAAGLASSADNRLREGGRSPVADIAAVPIAQAPRKVVHVDTEVVANGIAIPVEITVAPQGYVQTVRVLAPINPRVDDDVIDTVRQWVYTPTYVDGLPIAVVFRTDVTQRKR